jgi:YHS domain-containing protein
MKKSVSRFSNFPWISSAFLMMAIIITTGACNQKPASGISEPAMHNTDSAKTKFTAAMVDNKKDPSCGMPVTAGIQDTAHYNGKVYGFCSDECKQAFLKDPAAMAKKADLKP